MNDTTSTFINTQAGNTSNILPNSATPPASLFVSLTYPASSYEASIEAEATDLEAMIGSIVKLNLRGLYKVKIDMMIDRIATLRNTSSQHVSRQLAHKFNLEVL